MKSIKLSEVKEHDGKHQDPWIIIDGKVISIETFKDEHAGGDEILLKYSGRDVTMYFNEIGHSNAARNEMQQYIIGQLEDTNNNNK